MQVVIEQKLETIMKMKMKIPSLLIISYYLLVFMYNVNNFYYRRI